MGCYIQGPNGEKVAHIKRKAPDTIEMPLDQLAWTPDGPVPVIVIDNGLFDAALVVYNQAELDYMHDERRTGDTRPYTCLMVPRGAALNMIGDQAEIYFPNG